MKNIFLIKPVLVSLLLFWACQGYAHRSIELFTISDRPFIDNDGRLTPCYLDDVERLSMTINESLRQQQHVDRDSLRRQYHDQFAAISSAYLCQYRAKILGITRVPAIVFDGHYVIYGITVLSEAEQQYQQFQESHDASMD